VGEAFDLRQGKWFICLWTRPNPPGHHPMWYPVVIQVPP
jgi:hypothetical protein